MKPRTSLLTAATVLIGMTPIPVMAADSGIPPRGPVPFEVCDANADGYVDEQEFNRVRSERVRQRSAEGRQMLNMSNAPKFADIDSDGDGRLSPQEHQSHQRQRQQMRYGDGPNPGW